MRIREAFTKHVGSWRFAVGMMAAAPLRTWTHVIACSWGVVFLVFFDTFLYELRSMNMELITKAAVNEKVLDFPVRLDEPLARQMDRLHLGGVSFVPWTTLSQQGLTQPMMGVTRSFFELEGFRLLRGRPMDLTDGLAGSPECWVSVGLSRENGDKEETLGERVIDGKVFQVAGVYRLRKKQHPLIGFDWAALRPWPDGAVLIPMSSAVRLLPKRTGRFSLLVRVSDPTALLESWDEISLVLEDLGLNADEAVSRETKGLSDALEQLFDESRRTILVTQALIFFFAWANATNLMVRQTRQRTREIGIMKSVGAGRCWIFVHFLREAVVLGVLSGLFGSWVGAGASFLVGMLIDWKVSLHWDALKLGFASGLVAAFTISLIPAWVAARMVPVKALKE